MFAQKTVFAAMLLIATCVSAGERKPLDSKKIIGNWQSVKLEGTDIGSYIISVEADFGKDGQVTLVAKLKEKDGVVLATKTGPYKVVMEELEMTFDNETRRCKAWFEEDRLVVQDPSLDSRIHFERVKPVQ